jgi:hypothetical protein
MVPWLVVRIGRAAASAAAVDLREALRAYLLADAALAALVGPRVRPGSFAESDALPGITYRVVSDLPAHTLRSAAGTVEARIQFDAWGRTLAECVAIGRRVKALLDGWQDRAARYGVEVIRAEKVGEVDLHEPPSPTSEYWLYHVAADYRVKYRDPFTVYDP